MNYWKPLRVFLLLFIALFATISNAEDSKVCWKPTYGRGVGTIPTKCNPGQQYDAGLCYNACPPGRVGVGPACHTPCPAGWAPVGVDPTAVSCWKPQADNQREFSYPRGAGYVIWDGDKCARENGQGCELQGALHYPKCRAGYVGVGPVCWQTLKSCPNGFRDDGLACAKPGLQGRGVGVAPTACENGGEYQAGLCYAGCKPGFYGVGPVCWGQCPKDRPIDCGAMCGLTADECAKAITAQVVGVLQVVADVALTVATAGAGAGATAGANAAKAAAETSGKAIIGTAVKQTAKGVAKATIKKELIKLAKDAGKSIAENQLEQLANAASGEDFDFTSLDPTGIASMIKNFVLPMCNAAGTPSTTAPAPASTPATPATKPAAASGTRLVKSADNATVYLVDPKGAKRPIANPDVFNGCGLDWGAIQTRPAAEINGLPTGPALTTPAACLGARLIGSAIKGQGDAIYLVDGNGAKRHITNPQVFTGCGLDWNAVQTLPAFTVNALGTGAPLQSPAECQAARKGESAPAPMAAPAPAAPANGPASYGRGAGYAVWDEAKCNRENKQGCEKDGAIFYPKCNAGYKGVGPVCWKQ